MYPKLIVIFLFSFLLCQFGFSNTRSLPGYYVSLTGDTIHCNIEFNDWKNTPRSIQVESNNSRKEFTPKDIKAFGVYGYGDYSSSFVSYHTNPVSGKDIPAEYSDSKVTESRFLQILDNGHYKLYDLVFPDRVYYFASLKDSTIYELTYRAKEKNDTLMFDRAYRKEIFNLFVTEGIVSTYITQINSAEYNSSDFLSLFRILNESYSGVKYKKKSSGKFTTQVFVGGIRNSFSSTDQRYYQMVQFNPAYTVGGGINFLYSIPGHFSAFKIGMSFGYNRYNVSTINSGSKDLRESPAVYSTVTYHDTLITSNSLLLANLYLMYVVNPLSKTKLFLKAGAGYNFSLNNEKSLDSKYSVSSVGFVNGTVPANYSSTGEEIVTDLKNKFPSLLFSIGVIAGRSSLEFSYSPYTQQANPGNDVDSPPGQDFKLSYLALYYYFSIFK